MALKLSKELYKRDGIVYQKVYTKRPIYVVDTGSNTKVDGVLLWDGVSILTVPSHKLTNFKKLGD